MEKELAKLGTSSQFSSPKWDYWQTVLSRGGSDLSKLMEYVYKNGGKLNSYKSGIKELDMDITKEIYGYEFGDVLPWDTAENYSSKEHLLNEYKRLIKKL